MLTSDFILTALTRQRFALIQLRKEFSLSRTDIEILAFAKKKQMFTVYEAKQFYSHTNIQQLRTSILRLEDNGLLDLIKKGYKNKPSVYWLTKKGECAISKYVHMLI